VETLCGVIVAHDVVHLQPCLPPHWPLARVTLRLGSRQVAVMLCGSPAIFAQARVEQPDARLVHPGASVRLSEVAGHERWLVPAFSAPAASAARSGSLHAEAGPQGAAVAGPLAGG
jgi:cyclic beta-1,2-glucan synthetase